MRAKYARQIRAGVTRAQFEVGFTMEFGHPPMSLFVTKTELEEKAYDRTLRREIAKQVAAVGTRMLKKVEGFISEKDGAVQGVKEAVADLEKIRRGQ